MKKTLTIVAILVLFCVSLTGCIGTTSEFKTVAMVQSNLPHSAYMKFSSFEGRKEFKLNAPGQLKYTAKLGDGSATVYYNYDGTKTELFTVEAGIEVNNSTGSFEKGTIDIIVETNEECKNGEFHFDIE